MHPATVHAASGTRRGSPPQRRIAVRPRFARHRHATTGNQFRLLDTVLSDAAGHPVAVADPLGRVTRNTWDGNGNLVAFTDAKGNPTTWTYDARNRPLTKTDALGKTETDQYDAAGNPIYRTDRKGRSDKGSGSN